MVRLVITFLACLMFLVFGFAGEEVLNIVHHTYRSGIPLPPLTLLLMHSFPLNAGCFIGSVFPFCAAMFIVLLLTSSKKPIIAPHHFAEGALLVLLLFGLYLGCFILAIVMPFHLLGIVMPGAPTILNVVTSVVNYALWLTVLALVVRLIVNRFRKGP